MKRFIRQLVVGFAVFSIIPCGSPLLAAVTALPDRNVTLLGNFDLYSSYSDVWGYKSISGKEWALIGTIGGTSIVDTFKPDDMGEVAFITGPNSQWRDIKTWDHYAYVVTEGAGTGLQIIDLEAFPQPQLVNTYATGFTTAHNLFIDENGFAYIVGTGTGMFVLDLADPVNPVQAGFYGDHYIHDVFVRDGLAYAAEIYRSGLEILDVSDKAAITPLGFLSYFGAVSHNVWTTDDGQYALTTDETSGGHLKVFDVSNPAAITEIAHYQRDVSQTVHNITIDGNFAFLSHYVHGLRVLDITDPRFPVEVGGYDTFPSFPPAGDGGGGARHPEEEELQGAVIYDGAWGVYPYNDSGNIFISDISTGLYVLSFTPDYGVLSGTIRDQSTLLPLEGVVAKIRGEDEVTTFADGTYRLVTPPGTRQVKVSRFGYRSVEFTEEMVAGNPVSQNIDLVPLPSGSLEGFVTGTGGSPSLDGATVSVTGTPLATQSASGGDYSFGQIPAGFYRVRFDRAGFVPRVKDVLVTAGGIAQLDGELDPSFLVVDMETNPLWSVGAPGDTAVRGTWERGDPNGTAGGAVAPEDDSTPDPGVNAWVTGLGIPGATVGVHDVDGGATTLTSSILGLPAGPVPPLLVYDRWYSNSANGNIDDSFLIQISGDGGSSWSILELVTQTEVPWKTVVADPTTVAGSGGSVRLRFVASDTGLGSLVEAGVDQLEIQQTCQVQVNPFLPDADADLTTDVCDPCPFDPFDDLDGDLECGDTDNAPNHPNPGQEDADGDGIGDPADNCLEDPNAGQLDADGDGAGNACDADDDDDGVPDFLDPDADGDGIADTGDVCVGIPDPLQNDHDLDGAGDACDPDDGLITGLMIHTGGRLTWDWESGVDGYRIRRGSFINSVDPTLAVCLGPDLGLRAYFDPFIPPGGQGFFYIVTTVTGGVEGPSFASDGIPRTLTPCP